MSRFSSKQCLALMHLGVFTDTAMLTKGLYECDMPTLYPEGTTISRLVELAENLELQGVQTGNYIANVTQCQLVPVTLLIEPV